MQLETATTPRKLRIISAIFDYGTAREAHEAKPDCERRDDRTYHVVGYGPARYMLAYIVDADCQEVTQLRHDDDVKYCA